MTKHATEVGSCGMRGTGGQLTHKRPHLRSCTRDITLFQPSIPQCSPSLPLPSSPRPSIHTDLVVTSDDDDADASSAAVLDGDGHLLAGRVQHAYHTHECHVGLQAEAGTPWASTLMSMKHTSVFHFHPLRGTGTLNKQCFTSDDFPWTHAYK